jgi:hypothetical protein
MDENSPNLVTLASLSRFSPSNWTQREQGGASRVTRSGEFSPIMAGGFFGGGQFFGNFRSSTTSWAAFVHGTSYVLIVTKNGLGYILGDFFINASGHSGR